jgi:hypothetical protein
VFTIGRFIVDCAHVPYNSEIHPPNTLAVMRTEAMPGFSDRTTRAQIWVNRFFGPGPVSFTINPPPRPSATAQLVWVLPVEEEASIRIAVEEEVRADGIRLTFSGPPNDYEITGDGQVRSHDDSGGQYANHLVRSYEGVWNVFWD